MGIRLYTILGARGEPPRVRHYVGLPAEAGGKRHAQHDLEPARALLVEQVEDGYLLNRYGSNGEFAGDTWHSTLEEAKAQAEFEFGEGLREWLDVPPSIDDAEQHVVNQIS